MKNRRHRRSDRRHIGLETLESRLLLASTPIGNLDVLSRTLASGWAANGDDGPGALNIEININGSVSTVVADDLRADLAVLGSPYHAFTFSMPALPPGVNTVRVTAVSPFSGARKILANANLNNPAPVGVVDVASNTRFAGWVWDQDASSALTLRIDVNGVQGTPFTSNVSRPDVAGAVGAVYNLLGFDVTGSYSGSVVEIFAMDAPSGTATRIYSNNRSPIGSIDVNNGLTVSGWMVDQDSPSTAISYRVDIDGVTLAGTPATAGNTRNDLIGLFGSSNHGFSTSIPGLTPGSHTIAVYTIDAQTTAAKLLGQATVTNAPPVGVIDQINSTHIKGWGLDPNLGASPATIKVYADDFLFGSFTASNSRPDLTGPYGSPNHGFDINISTLPAGSHAITVTVLDDRTSDESEVVIYDDFINNHAPIGSFDAVNGTSIIGWAFDSDAPNASIAVDIYVDGVYSGTVSANQARADIDGALPTPNHAFNTNLPLIPFGVHLIELYASESQGNVSILLGSKQVTNTRPIGAIDVANTTTVSGWAADINQLGVVIGIRVFVNGSLAVSQNTSVNRPDLLGISPFNTMPGFSMYGYSITLPSLSVGNNQIDVYAVDKNNNILSPLGSRVVVYSPV